MTILDGAGALAVLKSNRISQRAQGLQKDWHWAMRYSMQVLCRQGRLAAIEACNKAGCGLVQTERSSDPCGSRSVQHAIRDGPSVDSSAAIPCILPPDYSLAGEGVRGLECLGVESKQAPAQL